MATRKYDFTTSLKRSPYMNGIKKCVIVALILFPFLSNAQTFQTTPILQDPMNNTIFSFYPFQLDARGVGWNHKDDFHSLANTIDDPTDPNDLASGMWFRMMFPNGFDISDQDTKYPLILFFHGAGEKGSENTRQMYWGGELHRDAVESGEFPGILLYPQQNTTNGGWPANGVNWQADEAFDIVKKLIKYYNVDPNRIYVHGLSGGGVGTWMSMIYYPKLVAAAFPMSESDYQAYINTNENWKKYIHIPIWLSQGGRDPNPLAWQGNESVRLLRQHGASIRYAFMPDHPHQTWTAQYAKPDFFPWFLQYSKTSIHVFYEQAQFCSDDQVPENLKLGVTAGFDGYEWAFNSTSNVIATGVNEIIATSYGDYYVRIRRGTEWTDWSEPRTIDNTRQPSPTPVITSGLASVTLPALDGSQSVNLYQSDGPTSSYKWHKDSEVISGAINNNYTAAQQGDYTLTARTPAESGIAYADYWITATNTYGTDGVLDAYPTEYRAEPMGCESAPSNIVRVTTSNGPDSPLTPRNFFVFSRGSNENELVFDDNSDNETGFEIYRSEDDGLSYNLIAILPASDGSASISYSDNGLQAGIQYCYRIRAVNGDGGSPYTEMACVSTLVDTTPPVPPILSFVKSTDTSISLSWVSSDDVGVVGYDLYRNGVFLTSSTQTAYVNINLTPLTSYTYFVVAKDAAGNQSTSNQIAATTVNNGLNYKYYHFTSNLSTVNQIENRTLIREGIVENFDITVRDATRNDRFGFVFEGYIKISTEGTYRFYSSSDDGSRVIVDGTTAFNNDGAHSCGENSKTPTPVYLTAGFHQIRVLFFENQGEECLTVNWSGPGISKSPVPTSVLFVESFSTPSGPNAPSNLVATPISSRQINLSWTDNSNNETGFEIYRSAVNQSAYQLISVVSAGDESYSDDDLLPATTYYYKILAKNNVGVSGFVYANAQTQPAPQAPFIPSNLSATAISNSQISLSWTDNSSNELGFEIYRATYEIASSYLLIATTAPNAEGFDDSGLPGGTTFYYKIRAKGDVNNSSFTLPVNALTLNSPPVITTIIPDRSVQINTVLEFEVRAVDPDLHVVTFSTDGPWPAFGTVTNIGQNRATVRFENPDSYGSYTLRLSATDGYDVVYSNSFTLTVNDNVVPVITDISDQQMREGETLTVNISASDDSGVLNLTTNNLPSFATFDYGGSGGTASIVFNPAIEQAGYYGNIQVVANDGQGGIVEESFNLVVDAVETSYMVYLSFDNVPRFSSPWNFIGGTELRILSSGDIWPIGNIYTDNQILSPITIDAVEMEAVPDELSFDNTVSYKLGGPGIVGYNVLPDDVILNGLASFRSESNKLIIRGLEDLLSYEFNFMSSVKPDWVTDRPWTTTFRINGISKTIDPVGNATEFVRFVDIRPTNGEIEIEMVSSGGSRTMLNAFTMEAYYSGATPPLAPSNLVLEARSSNSILVKWTDNSTNETDFDIYRRAEEEASFSLVGSVEKNIDSLLDQSGINGTTRYYYYVQARNSYGVSNSETLDVISLNALPVIAQLDPFAVKTGQKVIIPVSASDYENDHLTLFLNSLPSFVSFVDYGDGTGTITLDPDESVVGQRFELELIVMDSKGGTDSSPVIFEVVNGSYLQIIYLNLTQTNVLETSNWNNLTANPATTVSYSGIKDINGVNTSIGIALSGTWSGQEAQGLDFPLTYSEDVLFPSNVMNGFWYTVGVGNITFTGLDTDLKYNISLFSSSDASDSLENIPALTQFSTGALVTTVDAFKNPNRLKKLSGLSPDALGNIIVSIESLGDVRAVLNAMIIESYVDEQKPFAPSNVVAEVKFPPYTEVPVNPASFYVELDWADNSGIESGFEIYRYDYETGVSSLIYTADANEQRYIDHNLTRDKKVGYRLRAIGPTGVSEFASIADIVSPAYRILLNVNYNFDNVIASGWNNTDAEAPFSGFAVENLRDDLDNTTDIGFGVVSRELGAAGAAFTGVDDAGLYPVEATRTFFHIGNGAIDQYQWFGLDDELTYDLVFFGSRIWGEGTIPVNGHTTYKVREHSVSLNAWYNKDRSVIIRDITPAYGGISFTAGQTFSSQERWNVGFINVVELRVKTNKDSYPANDFNYYAAENSNINTLSNWYSNPDETGENPPSFSDQGLNYVIANQIETNLTGNLSIGGSGSKMILKDDAVINFTANNLTLDLPYLEIDEGASVTFAGSGLSTATINIGDWGLNIRDGATLDIGNAEVNITGEGTINSINASGAISANGGSINIVNTSSEPNNLYFTDGSSLTSLKIDNSNLATLTLNDSIRIIDKLEVTNGHLVTNGYVMLISDENSTAMIPQVGATSTITGAVEYQRYWARSKGGYYYIGVPVQGQSLEDWQTDFYIQGVQGRYPTYWTNVYTFNEPTNAWDAMDNITNTIEPGRGIAALMFNSDFADGFIRYSNTGDPVYGTFRVDLTYTDRGDLPENQGWQLVANPYACAIDLNSIDWDNDVAGLGTSVYLWDGATSMYDTWNPSQGSRAVASGQGFFMKADGNTANPYIDFKEAHKIVANPSFLRTSSPANLLTFRMINQDSIADKFYVVVNEAATFEFESRYDAFKYKNSSHNLYGTDQVGNKLAINSIPALRVQDTLKLNVESAASKSYEFEVTGLESLDEQVNIYLIDSYLNTTRLLNEGDRIPFVVDKGTSASFGQRFSLVIGQPGVISLKNIIVKSGKAFKLPLSLGRLENVAEMTIGVRFNASEFKLKGVNLLNTLPGVTIDTASAGDGIITLTKNSGTGALTLPDILDFVEFEFRPLINKTGMYYIWIDPESSVRTSESVKYAVLTTDATIDLRSLRKLKGNIIDQKGRPFNNAVVRLKSHFDTSTASPVNGSYSFDILHNLAYDVEVAVNDLDYSNPDLLDLVQITRYVNKFEQIPSKQILYSSDLNDDGKVNVTDLAQLQTLILSKQDKHPGRTVFNLRTEGIATRLAGISSESSGTVSFVADEDYELDFLASRKGEVYRNTSNVRENESYVDILFDLIPDNQKYDIMHLNLYMEKNIELSGFELHMNVENSEFEIIGVENLTDHSIFFNEFHDNTKNQLGLLWISLDELSHTITNEKPFLALSLKRKTSPGSPLDNIIEVDSDSKIVGSGFQVSSIREITPRNFGGSENSILTLYPNPSNGQLNAVINSSQEDNLKFVFINASGQILFEEVRHVYKGTNTIDFTLSTKQHYLAPGYYLMRTENSHWTDVKPFIIKH